MVSVSIEQSLLLSCPASVCSCGVEMPVIFPYDFPLQHHLGNPRLSAWCACALVDIVILIVGVVVVVRVKVIV